MWHLTKKINFGLRSDSRWALWKINFQDDSNYCYSNKIISRYVKVDWWQLGVGTSELVLRRNLFGRELSQVIDLRQHIDIFSPTEGQQDHWVWTREKSGVYSVRYVHASLHGDLKGKLHQTFLHYYGSIDQMSPNKIQSRLQECNPTNSETPMHIMWLKWRNHSTS